jgi:hypothetical protein
MRKLRIVSVALLVLWLVGCGSKGGNQVQPASLTPEQLEADGKNQKEAAAAEGKRRVSLPKSPNGQPAAENAERHRQGGH